MRRVRFLALIVFMGVVFTAVAYGSESTKEILTQKERLWLSENESRLVYAVETNYSPFVFIDSKGEAVGLAYDYLHLVESKLGVHFKERRFSSLDDIFSKVRSHEIHIVNAVTATKKRSAFLLFTDPFISVPNVIIVNKSRQDRMGEKDLRGLRVSLVKSYAVTEYLTNKEIVVTPELASDDLTALLNVSFGISDAAVVDLATASYLISTKGITNLKVAGEIDFNIQLAMATSKEEPLLRSILQKGIDSITNGEREEIHQRWINASGESIFNDWRFWAIVSGVLFISFIVVVWNRTLQKQVDLRTKAEEKLHILNAELTRKVEDAVAQRMRVEVDHFKEMERLKTLFVASMSHELRTPLNAIIGFSGVLKSEMAGPLNGKQKEQLNRIHKAGEHLLKIVIDVLDISKIESGQLSFVTERFSIKELLEELLQKFEPSAEKKGIELRLVMNEDIEVATDRHCMVRAVENYLTNALKYSEKGAVTISANQNGNFINIEISDEGIGIAADKLDKLFQPFERLESPLKVLAGGTGLGLYLTRKIVEDMMGGKVYVHSHLGEGSTFGMQITPDTKTESF